MKKKPLIIGALVAIGIVGLIAFGLRDDPETVAAYSQFAQCLEREDATFYGAFWCSHCNEQKRLFRGAEDALPYVECSTPDRNGQTQVCNDAGIQSYPTWEFADGERRTGVVPIATLAEETGCNLPNT